MQRMPILGALGLSVALGMTLSVPRTEASQFVPVSLEEITRSSDAVVRGQVVDVVSEWSEDEEVIFTWAVIDVSRAIRGTIRSGERILVKEVGGTVDGMTISAIGFPRFAVGDDLVLFLTRWDDGEYRVNEYAQGFYQVARSRRDGGATLRPGRLQDLPDAEGVDVDLPIATGAGLEVVVNNVKAIR